MTEIAEVCPWCDEELPTLRETGMFSCPECRFTCKQCPECGGRLAPVTGGESCYDCEYGWSAESGMDEVISKFDSLPEE